jgi:hypothetical protein
VTTQTRTFGLTNTPAGLGLSCDAAGLALAGVPLLRKGLDGFTPRAPGEIEALLLSAYGDGGWTTTLSASGLATVAEALNRGDLAKAMMAAVFLKLPELDPEGALRMARTDEVLAKYAGQPRQTTGRFAEGKLSGGDAHQERRPPQPSKPTVAAPHVQSQTTTHVATAADFATPKTPSDAPKAIQFSPTLQNQFNVLWTQSFPGSGSLERGGTIMTDRRGNLSLQNIGGTASTWRDFHPDLVAKDPANYKPVGLFHTHPYAKSEGGYTGIAIDGADAGGLIDSPAKFCIAQSGEKQFMFVKTGATQPHVLQPQLKAEGQDDVNAEAAKGNNFADASTKAAVEIARKYGLAYYEGSHGHFTRVYPR